MLSNEVLLRSKIAQLEGKTKLKGGKTAAAKATGPSKSKAAKGCVTQDACCDVDATCSAKNSKKGAGVGAGMGVAGRAWRKPEGVGDVMRRFEDQVLSEKEQNKLVNCVGLRVF